MGVSSLLKRLEVKPTDDEYEVIETTRWGNRDVYPIPHDKRTYGVYAFVAYWGKFRFSGRPLLHLGKTSGLLVSKLTNSPQAHAESTCHPGLLVAVSSVLDLQLDKQ